MWMRRVVRFIGILARFDRHRWASLVAPCNLPGSRAQILPVVSLIGLDDRRRAEVTDSTS